MISINVFDNAYQWLPYLSSDDPKKRMAGIFCLSLGILWVIWVALKHLVKNNPLSTQDTTSTATNRGDESSTPPPTAETEENPIILLNQSLEQLCEQENSRVKNKNMIRRKQFLLKIFIISLIVALIVMLILVGSVAVWSLFSLISNEEETPSSCTHQWQPATCTSPEICLDCGKIGETAEHQWTFNDCEQPQVCAQCNAAGNIPGHQWMQYEDGEPPLCQICEKESKEPRGKSGFKITATHDDGRVATASEEKYGTIIKWTYYYDSDTGLYIYREGVIDEIELVPSQNQHPNYAMNYHELYDRKNREYITIENCVGFTYVFYIPQASEAEIPKKADLTPEEQKKAEETQSRKGWGKRSIEIRDPDRTKNDGWVWTGCEFDYPGIAGDLYTVQVKVDLSTLTNSPFSIDAIFAGREKANAQAAYSVDVRLIDVRIREEA